MNRMRLDVFAWLAPLLACACGADRPEELSKANRLSQVSRPLSTISEAAHAEMEQYITNRARDVVYSDTTNSGDLVECTPIESQASLNGEKIGSPPPLESGPVFNSDPQFPEEVATPEGGDICPPGTVPRLGVTLKDLERAGSLANFFQKNGGEAQPLVPGAPGSSNHAYATSRSIAANYGGAGILNLWAPSVDGHRFSLSQLWVWGGSGSGLQTLEAGWQVYPDKYGNYSSHLFTFYTPNNYTNGCYNHDCSGFVQTSSTIFPGQTFSPASISGGSQYTMYVWYTKEAATGRWWLYVQSQAVGYYPGSLFNAAGIATSAVGVDFGGEISSLRTYTDMGGGAFPSSGFGYAAYTRTAQVNDTTMGWVDPPSLTPYAPEPYCYDISLDHNSSWGSYMYFGGPGTTPSCPL